MRKTLLLIFFFVVFLFPKNIIAYEQTESVCYSQCAAYKFGWKGDFCYDLFMNQCAINPKDALKNFISLVKDTATAMAKGKLMTIVDVSTVFKAMFVCKPLIEDCIVPELNKCENACRNISLTYYSPELSVGNPYGSVSYHNVYYDEDKHELVFKVVNYGGYAWDIGVTASWGHTRNRDKKVSGGGTLFTEKIPELVFLGARMSSPKTPGDVITDFLIDESNFSKYLQGFKSDADNHYIPPVWYKTVPFTAPEGEYTKVILNVDYDRMIPEGNEGDNTYILEIDKLPTPASFQIDKLTYHRTDPYSLTDYIVDFDLKNNGEESGSAHVKWYLGKYEPGKSPFHQQEMVVQGKNKVIFSHMFNVDVSGGADSCNRSQNYTLVVFDDDGFIKTQYEFSIPKFAGSINGRVEDLFGKKVVGATITTSTGQTATVNSMGYYHVRGIPTLGKVTITATHPDFSQPVTKEVEIKFDDSQDKCHIEGLTQQANFILKDQDVFFNVVIKDTSGNPITAQVLASNKDWRFDQQVAGQAPLPGMQPGQYTFFISAPGYKAISQTVNAVPNNQNLEFVLEKLNGRTSDGGLNIFEPRLLWQMDRGEEILSKVTATKDGKEIILYTTRNKLNTGKLYFLNLETGSQIKIINNTISTKGQSQACLDTSYDGNTTLLYVHAGTFGIARDTKNTVKLFTNQGGEFGAKEFESGGGVGSCDVSPDGFYVYADRLLNKGLYVYTIYDILGIKDREEDVGYAPHETIHFTTQDNIISGCPDSGGDQCVQTIHQNIVTSLGNFKYGARAIDSSQNASKIGLITIKDVFFFNNANKLWEKNIELFGDRFPQLSVSPGGGYVIYTTVGNQGAYPTIKIFTDNNIEKTPVNLPHPGREEVMFVHANDKGLFFMTQYQKKLKFYQVGGYSTDYNPPTVAPTATESTTNALSYYENGFFHPAGNLQFNQLIEGLIYMANRTINFNMGDNYGSLHILEGTIFSVDANHRPILLKGQMTADFTSPMIIYAIKFDRYDMNLFKKKLGQLLWSKNLPEDEYFVIKNIHTKFTVRNLSNDFNVAVDSGQVSVLVNKSEKKIDGGKQISIDVKNNIRESIYFSSSIIFMTAFILLTVVIGTLFYYRNTKIGVKIISVLKTLVVLFWKTAKILISIMWGLTKSFLRLLMIVFQKLLSKKEKNKKK